MFNKERSRRIFDLSSPIIVGMISQNTLNLVDTAMVGKLGASSLAAVGISGMITFMIQAILIGVGSGVQAIAARKKGEGKISELPQAISSGMIFSIVFALPLTLASMYFSEQIFRIAVEDEQVRVLAKDFFDIRIAVSVFSTINFAFRGFWNAIDSSRTYMFALISTHLLNIVLNYLLIFGNLGFPALGVKGSALATSISITIGTLIYLVNLFFYLKHNSLRLSLPSWIDAKTLSKISFVSGIETFFTMINVVLMYWLVGKIGTADLASTNIMMNIMMVAFLPAIGFGISLATLSGQALGRSDPKDALRWGDDVIKISLVLFLAVSLPMAFLSEMIVRIFTDDQEVVRIASQALRIMGFTLPFEMLGFIYLDALKGLGDTKTALKVSFVLQWLFFTPIAAVFVLVLHWGFLSVWLAQTTYHIIQSTWFYFYWNSGKGLVRLKA